MNMMVTETQEGQVEPVAQTDATLTAGIEANATMNQTPSADAEKNVVNEQILAEYNAKWQKDLNSMKSTFQRKEAERENQWKAREADYQQQLENLKLSTMDEEQRKAYEQDSFKRRYSETEQRYRELEQRALELEASQKAQNYFLAQGVPITALKFDEGYDELWNSGMEFITSELQRLKNQPAAPSASPAKPEVKAPAVVTGNGQPAFGGPSWDELRKVYGDEETVYRLVETGQLSPDVIPVPQQFRK